MFIQFSSIENNIRLDKYFSSLFNISRKRVSFLIEKKNIKLNNKLPHKSEIVSYGDLIEINLELNHENYDYSSIKILFENNYILSIYKPAKFHSAITSKNPYSVEHYLKQLNKKYILLNRLDFLTQGILIAAKKKEFLKKYRLLENKLLIAKYYICFVKGELKEPKVINYEIDYKKRKKVKVLNKKSDIHITVITPLAIYKNFTIVKAKIFKGARHQIRAHLAKINHPIIGDPLYGENNNEKFFLLCYCYKFKNRKFKLDFLEKFTQITKESLKKII